MDTGNQTAAPAAPVAVAASAPYVSATRPNWREWGLLALIAAATLLALGLPWLFISVANSSGIVFDTWKPLQPGAPLEHFLPDNASDYVDTPNGILAQYEGGMWALVTKFDTPSAAQDAWKSRWAADKWPVGVMSAATNTAPGQWLAYGHMDDGRFIEWVNSRLTLQFFAPDDAGLSQLIAASQLIDAPEERGFGHGMMPLGQRLLHIHPARLAVVLDVLILGLLAGLFWYRLLRLRARPPAGLRKAGRETLRNRLLGLNNANTPLLVEEQGPYHYVCRWKLDDPVHGPWLAGCNLRKAYQLDLYLEEDGTAGALETIGRVDWDSHGGARQARLTWNYLRAVEVHPTPAPAAEPESVTLPMQSSNAADYRQAVQQLVLGSGWTWKPMLFRPVVWEHK